MKIIKLNAIDSTSSFLKDLAVNNKVEDFTVVVTENQTAGRGQMNSKWEALSGKDLTFSVLCCFCELELLNYKYLNFCVSLSVYDALNELVLPRLKIKWPNDIMSENKKIAGVLIENVLKNNTIDRSVIGIGVNVNQEKFPLNLPNASSLKNILNKEINLELLMHKILSNLKNNIELLKNEEFNSLEKRYLSLLYKKNVPSMFKTAQNTLFMGKIIGVSEYGNLQIELENETVKEYGLKEISFA